MRPEGQPPPRSDVVGVLLAGGLGRRIGGDKAVVSVEGRALADYPLAALRAAGLAEIAVVVKRDTVLPGLPASVGIWVEPEAPRHPLTGIVHALHVAGDRPVLVCAADMPLVDGPAIRQVLDAARPGDVAVIPRAAGELQPLCALYRPAALPHLDGFPEDASVRDVVLGLHPRILDVEDATPFFNVNRPEDVLHAGHLLRVRATAPTRT